MPWRLLGLFLFDSSPSIPACGKGLELEKFEETQMQLNSWQHAGQAQRKSKAKPARLRQVKRALRQLANKLKQC